ncbi:MAG: hypothetical protein ACLSIF_06555 [Faecalimonas umbilicata]
MPTAFCSYTGEALDQKDSAAALDGSALDTEAMRLLRLVRKYDLF